MHDVSSVEAASDGSFPSPPCGPEPEFVSGGQEVAFIIFLFFFLYFI